ncbi:MAG: DUF4065 domain-containing protein, partial [Mogibacterium sp.]|nr:DUF4065 domain-containing protein [Mogibacterium sp.]
MGAKYSAKDIAEHVVTKCVREQEPITNLHLQKILYFIQRDYVKKIGEPLFADEFEAWKFGPVVPCIYYE